MGRKYRHRPPSQSRFNPIKELTVNGNGNRLIKPNSLNIETTYAPGPLANPSNVALQTPDGMKILVLGGLTKVEALAGQIASGMLHPGVVSRRPSPAQECATEEESLKLRDWIDSASIGEEHSRKYERLIAVLSVNMAEAILFECERRRNPPEPEA